VSEVLAEGQGSLLVRMPTEEDRTVGHACAHWTFCSEAHNPVSSRHSHPHCWVDAMSALDVDSGFGPIILLPATAIAVVGI